MSAIGKKQSSYRAGKTCSVVGCKNCGGFLKAWNASTCELHAPLLHQDCPCLQPYALYCFPQGEKNKETRRKWVANLQRKNLNPSKHAKVCSIHFVDGRPTETNPYPTLNLRTTNEDMQHWLHPLVCTQAARCPTCRQLCFKLRPNLHLKLHRLWLWIVVPPKGRILTYMNYHQAQLLPPNALAVGASGR
ncbi:uncharacterized protein ISCGN_022502 [Ixodes scapularis]